MYPNKIKPVCLAAAFVLLCLALSGCSVPAPEAGQTAHGTAEGALDTSRFLVVVDQEPDTVDFQCTSIYYTVALNVFNRLVELQAAEGGGVEVIPSLARAWEVSGDGRVYTFHLQKDVLFSNGSALTASDVLYTFTRLLTHPDSCNRDIASEIVGAPQLAAGEADTLAGFRVLGDLDFEITLAQPFQAFLSCLAMPGASILDAETTLAAGNLFGRDPEHTVGTGPFILNSWEPGKGMLLTANPHCWNSLPGSEGLSLRFIADAEAERKMFEDGELDILDLDELGGAAEYFIHGDIYQDRLFQEQEIGITYIALNQAVKPLDDVRVRKAMQMALNRQMLLDAVYSGRGNLENGIFPRGLSSYNPDLPEIPYSPEEAARLLGEAGYPDGFDLKISVKSSSTQWEKSLMTMAASMWNAMGIRAAVEVMDENEFFQQRKTGLLACYSATWSADYNDADNFIYTFFGSRENAVFRSLGYANDEVIQRVKAARSMGEAEARLKEYQELERLIVQEEAAWIPLFSRQHYYVTGERIKDFQVSWNGWVSPRYSCISVIGQ